MIFDSIKSDIEVLDKDFNLIYPKYIQKVADIHFSPVKIAKLAAFYLMDKDGTKILDIGSGAGKFCMIGSACTEGVFVGIEQRTKLSKLAQKLSKRYNLTNITFINANIKDVSFKDFDAFYMFNSFYENISVMGAIDNTIDLNRELYKEYSTYVREQLDTLPVGTRLVTYYSFLTEIPDSYEVQFAIIDEKLKMWEKVR